MAWASKQTAFRKNPGPRFIGRLSRVCPGTGRNGIKEDDDYFVVDENLGSRQQKVEVLNLDFLRPQIVKLLQQLLAMFPGWEIVVGLSVPDASGRIRDMGLTIRAHEIVDGLQRRYLPEPYRSLRYEGSRPGTEND